ncbi:helical backbone metal receptor [Croceimicrobium sp.]|uniref:helical backbone metal receptor n=1 Tax=Croceimicrobium sp. TaxID=2828340 RepID=UPI003BA9FD83
MPEFRDQIGRSLVVNHRPQRIVSLVPSLTELIVDLGLESELIGLSSWCVQPPGLRESKTVIGGTKNPNIEQIKSLKPDLILANKEENLQEHITELAESIPVFVSDVRSLDQAIELITLLGSVVSRAKEAQIMAEKAQGLIQQLQPEESRRFLYFIWKDPYMVASTDTYSSALMEACGFVNVAPKDKGRYPQLSLSEIQDLKADLIFLSSEPYPFNSGDSRDLFPYADKVWMVNGEFFTWYGSRLNKTLPYLIQKPFALI